MKKELVNVGIVQTLCVNDKTRNVDNAVRCIEAASRNKAQIVCLQELFASPYFCCKEDYDAFDLAESIPGYTSERLASTAKKLGVIIIGSLFEKRASGIYHNTCAVFNTDGNIIGTYRKQHIPDDPGYHEKFYFTPGDEGYKVFKTPVADIGVLICWDQWFPEASRITCLKGADILFFPTAIGWPTKQDVDLNQKEYQAWQVIQRAHAIANGVHVIAVNRIGIENGNQFWGGSFISDPFGEILYQAPYDKETIYVHTLDLKVNEHYRTHWPFFRDRRTDTYNDIIKKFDDPE